MLAVSTLNKILATEQDSFPATFPDVNFERGVQCQQSHRGLRRVRVVETIDVRAALAGSLLLLQNTVTKSSLGRTCLLHLRTLRSQSVTGGSQARNSRQELRRKPWKNTAHWAFGDAQVLWTPDIKHRTFYINKVGACFNLVVAGPEQKSI